MKVCLALAVLAIGLVMIPSTEAWWGWGGLGGFYSPYSYSWGFPYYRYYRDTMSKGDITGRVSCKYIKERSFLSCGTQSGSVECGVVGNFTGLGKNNFELYGIGKYPTVETPVENIRFHLFPRALDNSAWWNHTCVENGKTVELALFHAYSEKYYGYRVTDLKCYERLVNLFKAVEPVNYENIVVVSKEVPTTRNCTLIGEILVDAPVRV